MGILSLPRDWVRRCVFYLACGIASLSCATHSLAGSGDVPARFAFHYRQYKEADRPEEQNAYVTLAVKTELDPGVSEEIRTALGFDRPDNLSVRPTSSAPLYAVPGYEWNGEGGIVLMVDESQGTDSGYDTLFMDMNYDGILAEDKKLVGRRRIELKAGGEERARVDFPLAQISLVPACIPHGEELVSYVRPTIFPGDPPVIELAFAADYCQGEIESDQRYNAILVDFDMSGRFDDRLHECSGHGPLPLAFGNDFIVGDLLVIDLNGDGRYDNLGAEPGSEGRETWQRFGEPSRETVVLCDYLSRLHGEARRSAGETAAPTSIYGEYLRD